MSCYSGVKRDSTYGDSWTHTVTIRTAFGGSIRLMAHEARKLYNRLSY